MVSAQDLRLNTLFSSQGTCMENTYCAQDKKTIIIATSHTHTDRKQAQTVDTYNLLHLF